MSDAGEVGRESSIDFAGVPDEFQRLWTPHRMAYIQAGPEPLKHDCPFCAAPGKSDEEGLIVARVWEISNAVDAGTLDPAQAALELLRVELRLAQAADRKRRNG